jgi:uncharacterized protein (TIGR02231 family)
MKHYFFFLSFALITNVFFAADKEIIKAPLTDVVVYSQGAQLTHKSNYNVKVGVSEIIIEGISHLIDAKSIQVKAVGNVTILDSRYSLFYPQPGPVAEDGIPLKVKRDIALLEDSLKLMGYDIQEIQDEIDVLFASKNMIMTNGAMKGQGRVSDSLNFLKNAVDYYQLKITEINKKMLSLNKRKAEKLDKKRGMEERLTALRNFHNGSGFQDPNRNKPIPRVIVTVKASEMVSGKLTLSYLVSNAGWTPLYDLRSESETGKITLTYKAQVYQNTGVDWNDVKLSISTNNPYANKTKPELSPWYIDYYNYQQQLRQEKSTGAPRAIPNQALNMGYSLQETVVLDAAKTADEFTKVVNQLISAEFRIDLPYTIKSNNEQHIVFVKQKELDTKFKYYAVPKSDPGVYLVAQMTKLDELQLVPSKANIFFDGTYIGETYIDPTTMDDTLNLSLGKDPNIIVKRTLLKKELKDKIVAEKRERTFAYAIEIKNLKANTIELVIQDQLPITQNGEITIDALELSKGKVNETTGLVEWSQVLKPKESKTIQFQYRVKHAKDKQVNL